ncbi:Transmembrane permease component of heme ABC transporter [Alloalcanivorax dieselolei B5]|uniref:Transmembrane permease component of heme ABC transporter n=1 Tax=Alcanivorax dieselolei (strain DSM 16502 / CGMCC 1.3690 / MCCC 1A00001 / B-5) TaxID=930169 RepID=K0CDL4_ALCDB|nr:iron ABC transporter permease [Alloalcanivorax dieselolei]AFT69666.1 Transmembrane permease component of heme ABC transporter [Alloalcanivorax dieselolei B5]GGK03302.1 hemin ABC transporter permease [Alloalcanivorax dieselolei]
MDPDPRRWPVAPTLTGLALLLLSGMVLAMLTGPMTVSVEQLWRGLWSSSMEPGYLVIRDLRLPRIVMGALVGGALASTGAVLQGLFRNPLADPGLIGISAGAALGAVAVIVLGASLAAAWEIRLPTQAIPVAAFLGALVTTMLIWRVASRGGVTQVSMLLLAGIAIGAIAMALTGLLTFMADDHQLRTLTFWSMGSLAHSRWRDVALAAPWLLSGIVLLPLLARPLNALILGEEAAVHLGFSVPWVKRAAILLSAVSVGAAVAAAGQISFVGLMAPHLVRLLLGVDHRCLIPGSAAMGALLMVFADVLARTLVVPAELPIGLVMALLGGPFFLFLLLRQRPL